MPAREFFVPLVLASSLSARSILAAISFALTRKVKSSPELSLKSSASLSVPSDSIGG